MKRPILIAVVLTLSACDNGRAPPANQRQSDAQQSTVASSKDQEPKPTRYADGRLSEVRVLNYYNFYRDPAAGEDRKNNQLILVAVEWGKYDAVLSDKNAAFAQLPNNTMTGGDTGTNEIVGAASKAFFKNAQSAFGQRRDELAKIGNAIPNRDVNKVSFDFITNQGSFTVQADRASLESGNSEWSAMFREALALKNKVAYARRD